MRESIYEIACEMLRATNIYNRDVSDIKYTNSQQDEITLLALVKVEASLGHSYRGRSERNLQLAYESIVFAIEKYLESYSAPFSFKQCTKAKFAKWMDKICDAYDISDPTCHNKLRVSNNEIDTGIVMLKALHPRKGVSIEELHDQLHRSKRAIQKDLVKLDSSLYKRGMSNQEKKEAPYAQFLLGGQPVHTDISYHDKDTHRRFYSSNTVHPIVLQENITQLATLLKALCHQFYDYEDDKSVIIAIDIWYQMSEYAQNKIKHYFAYNDSDFSAFIDMIDDDCPDDHVIRYYTEREMLKRLETPMPIDDALAFLMKVAGRTGTIILSTGERLSIKQLSPMYQDDGNCAYKALDINGNVTVFRRSQVDDIQL